MDYNPKILQELLRARALSRAALSERLGISLDELERELRHKPEPRQGLLNDIAKELALPPFVFFMKRTPDLPELLPDFRSSQPAPSPKSRGTIESIQFATAVQRAAEQLVKGGVSNLPRFTSTEEEDVAGFALHAREHFGISLDDQQQSTDARTFYTLCRKKIEEQNIFVLHDSYPEADGSGFCLAESRHPVIVVNTKKQTRGRRLFTLIHELAHVLMKTSGISDPFVTQNRTERLCNRFAANFLVPAPYAGTLLGGATVPVELSVEDVARLARRFKISQQAAVLRLEQLGLVRTDSHRRWLTAVHNLGNPDFSERGGGSGGPPPQEKVKLARYGFRLASAFDVALRTGLITDINLFRVTGLKPKYQAPYFDYARSISDSELRTLELDDGE